MSMTPSVEPSVSTAAPPPIRRRGWTAGRVISLVAGCIVGLMSLSILSAAGWATWETNTDRDAAGFITADSHTVATSGYVVTSNEFAELANRSYGDALGDMRLRATSTDGSAVFIGVAPAGAVDRYLAGVDRTVVAGWFPLDTNQVTVDGAAPRVNPTDTNIWTHQTSGPGRQSLVWRPEGDTTVVVMHPDGTTGLSVKADVAAEVPDLAWFAVALWAIGGVLLIGALALIVLPILHIRKEGTT